jgi:hypothetical protein
MVTVMGMVTETDPVRMEMIRVHRHSTLQHRILRRTPVMVSLQMAHKDHKALKRVAVLNSI